MVFVPTFDVEAHAARVGAWELVRRVEGPALVASGSGSPDSDPRPAQAAVARRTAGASSLKPADVVVDGGGILGAGPLPVAPPPAWPTARAGL